MTMQIDGKEQIAGVPVLQVRYWLAYFIDGFAASRLKQRWLEKERWKTYDPRQPKEAIRIERTIDKLVENLVHKGYIEHVAPICGRDDGDHYKLTILGVSFARGSAAKRVHRSTADKTLADLLLRVQEVNESEKFLMRVTELVVYGSYLREGDSLGDLDIAYTVEHKAENWRDDEYEPTLAAHRKESGRRFATFIDELLWPGTQVALHLKNRKRTISLHEMSDFVSMPKDEKFSCRVLMGDPDSIAARLKAASDAHSAKRSNSP